MNDEDVSLSWIQAYVKPPHVERLARAMAADCVELVDEVVGFGAWKIANHSPADEPCNRSSNRLS